RQALAGASDPLAALRAAETGAPDGDVRPQVAANALMGVQRALIEHVRRRVLADERPSGLPPQVRELAEQAFALLEGGLGGYAAAPDGPRTRRRGPGLGRGRAGEW